MAPTIINENFTKKSALKSDSVEQPRWKKKSKSWHGMASSISAQAHPAEACVTGVSS